MTPMTFDPDFPYSWAPWKGARLGLSTPKSVGPAERLQSLADRSRGRRAPPERTMPIPPKQRWLDRIRLSHWNQCV